MVRRRLVLGWLVAASLLSTNVAASIASERIRSIAPAEDGSSAAVVVSNGPLVHTSQLGGATLDAALDSLERVLAAANSSAAHVVKLNVYAKSVEQLRQAKSDLARRLQKQSKPAVCWVVSRLPGDANVAVDAVATTNSPATRPTSLLAGQAKLAPQGARIYVSGQAARNKDLATATRETLAGLQKTLEFVDRSQQDILQLKAFLRPMDDVRIVQQEIKSFFANAETPPTVFVEWQSGATVPIEIELVVWAGKEQPKRPVIEYLTPPGSKASPVFSRIARINWGSTIYVSSVAAKQSDAKQQVAATFRELEAALQSSGSDLRHMAKATYYVTNDDASRELGAQRTKRYDARRPPAASKAKVTAIGEQVQGFAMDMIAVPKPADAANR